MGSEFKVLGLDQPRVKSLLRDDIPADIELKILAFRTRDQDFYRRYREYVPHDFFAQRYHDDFAKVVDRYFIKYRSLPEAKILKMIFQASSKLSDSKKSALAALTDLVFAEPLTNRNFIIDLIKSSVQKRVMRAAALRISEITSEGGDPDDVAASIREVMKAAITASTVKDYPEMELTEDIDQILKFLTDEYASAVPTGVKPLDIALRGGLCRGEIGMVMAPPKRGKTLTLVNFAAGAVRLGYNVCYISLEDGVRGVAPRMCGAVTGIPVSAIIESNSKWEEVRKQIKALKGRCRILYRPARRITVVDVESVLEDLAAQSFHPDLVIVDYADLLRNTRSLGARWEELIEIYQDLRSLGQEYNCAIWTASQTHREGNDAEEPSFAQLAGAFQKAGEVDIGIAYHQRKSDMERGIARLFLLGMRNRSSGSFITLRVDREASRFYALSDVEDVPEVMWEEEEVQM